MSEMTREHLEAVREALASESRAKGLLASLVVRWGSQSHNTAERDRVALAMATNRAARLAEVAAMIEAKLEQKP